MLMNFLKWTDMSKFKSKIKKHKLIIIIALIIFGFLFSRFYYYNFIVPAPYKPFLDACLAEAKQLEIKRSVDEARNICFRTYPHFN